MFKGWKFTAPFFCMCCGMSICHVQWAFGRYCGICDTGKCNHPYNHGHHHIYAGPHELIDTTEAVKYHFLEERIVTLEKEPPEYVEWQKELKRQRDTPLNNWMIDRMGL